MPQLSSPGRGLPVCPLAPHSSHLTLYCMIWERGQDQEGPGTQIAVFSLPPSFDFLPLNFSELFVFPNIPDQDQRDPFSALAQSRSVTLASEPRPQLPVGAQESQLKAHWLTLLGIKSCKQHGGQWGERQGSRRFPPQLGSMPTSFHWLLLYAWSFSFINFSYFPQSTS